jgi:hypothetical protein
MKPIQSFLLLLLTSAIVLPDPPNRHFNDHFKPCRR